MILRIIAYMKTKASHLLAVTILASVFQTSFAQIFNRKDIDLNTKWTIYPAYNVNNAVNKSEVTLPHTWNSNDFNDKINYSREAMIYERKLMIEKEWEYKRVFLFFEGVNSVANVFINGRLLGEHIGGYTAFCYEITSYVTPGEEASLVVLASNSYRTDVPPLNGDFNIYGGIHRPVHLIITNKNCISPLDYGTSGVYVKPETVSYKEAKFSVQSILSLKKIDSKEEIRTTIFDASNKLVAQNIKPISSNEITTITQEFNIANPHLWNGKQNPYCYQVKVELLENGKVVDQVDEKTGFRFFKVDAENGFFLNGKYLDLYGFGRHEDIEEKGSALTNEDYFHDMFLILESGATAMRLTHYPHGKRMYELSDENGIVLWTEIPLVGPGGYTGPGYVNSPLLNQNIKQMLIEMIRQHINHPSVFFWGLFNELKLDFDNPVPFTQELNALAKEEDPSRLTTCASFGKQLDFNGVTDLIGWNEYLGWYVGKPEDLGRMMDELKEKAKGQPVCVSEYGAGGSITTHQFPVKKSKPTGKFHSEEWQTECHEGNWKELASRKYIWGKFIWNFADFGSSIRNEGDKQGINDKGLITYDHRVKKDAFYFYKANWNPEPMIYITSKRFTKRSELATDIKVFSNQKNIELFINGKKMDTKQPDSFKTVVWPGVQLQKGKNIIEVKTKEKGVNLTDTCVWSVDKL